MPITGHKNIKIVVSLALINEADEILLSKRPKNKHLAGFWEFPGGKIETGEVPEIALIREIKEELDININNSNGIYSAFKDLVRKEDCDQMSHMNVQYYFGKHADAIKCLFNKINSFSKIKIDYKILKERCIFSREVHLNSALEIVFKVKSMENNEIVWVKPNMLRKYKMPPADDALIFCIQDLFS